MSIGQGHKGPSDKIKKRAMYAIVILVLVAAGFLIFSILDGSPRQGAASEGISEGEGFSVSAVLEPAKLEFEAAGNNLVLTLDDSEGALLVDGLNFENFAGTNVIIEGYIGGIMISKSGSVVLDGDANSLSINNVRLNKGEKALEVVTEGVAFTSFKVSSINLESLKLVSSGNIDVASKGSFGVESENIEIKPFSGNIEIDAAELSVQGRTTNLLVEGVPRISVD